LAYLFLLAKKINADLKWLVEADYPWLVIADYENAVEDYAHH
jgi:hypothetical protein